MLAAENGKTLSVSGDGMASSPILISSLYSGDKMREEEKDDK